MRLVATSMSRYNGGVRALRLYGSRAITTFCVHRPEDDKRPELWVNVEVGGPTPGERKTKAKELAEPKIRELLAKHGIEV